MGVILSRGRVAVRWAEGAEDLARSRALRHLCFVTRGGARQEADGLDALHRHLLVEAAGRALATCRLRVTPPGPDRARGAAGRAYDLGALADHPGAAMEIGRFCVHPDAGGPDALRLLWGALARVVAEKDVTLMFGCASFPGAEVARHAPTLGWLGRERALDALVTAQAGGVALAGLPPGAAMAARAGLPPLLRSYLAMGGRVGRDAVTDAAMNTVHVFCAVPVADVPGPRARALAALAQEGP
ncbi:GNAT family N-acetyltransferase [Limimaricola pyoseonensis]|uniref:L-ornithine N(alpha)-acyltransferase n=1 Tax=Limimaricola pyoseonensis TaxID=521013 RepID=A0A1G7AQX9_9RHOB|nr:GNAT family N-acetyltransferase [Limimaricola pyoseonensis]SDE17259.1 Putative hemolysin [Limimaricola pyoseonensis]